MAGRSLQNVFAQSPTQAENSTVAAPVPQQTNPIAGFETLARQTRVPVNILMAEAERAGTRDPRAIIKRASEWQTRIASGERIEDIATALIPDAAETFLSRAVELDRAMYGDAAEAAPTGPQTQETNSGLENTARTVGGGLVRAGAATVKALGMGADSVIDHLTQRDNNNMIAQLEAANAGQEYDASTAQPMTTRFTEYADNVAQPITNLAEDIEAGRDAALNQEIAGSTIEGELFDPRTWGTSENTTLRGLFHKGVAVIGDLAPVVATAVITRSPSAAATVGGLTAAGHAGDEAVATVEAAYQDRDDSGVSRLERDNVQFQRLINAGMEPDAAAEVLANEARRYAATVAGVIGAAGGALTQRIMAPAAGRALTNGIGGRIALGATEEAAQEVAEGVAARTATNAASGLDENVMDGTLEEAVLGGVAGGVLTGVTAPFSPNDAPDELDGLPAPDPTALLPPPDGTPALPAPQQPVRNEVSDPDTPIAPPAPPAQPAKGRFEAMLDETSPSLTPDVQQGDVVTVNVAGGQDVSGEYVGETVEGVVLAVDGERVDVPRTEIESGAASISAGVPIPPAPRTDPDPTPDAIEQRRIIQTRLEQLSENARKNGMTTEITKQRDDAMTQLAALPVPPLPTTEGVAPDATQETTAFTVTTAEPDFHTNWPAPDPQLFAEAARAGRPIPLGVTDVVQTATDLLADAVDILDEIANAPESSPRADRLDARLARVWGVAATLWDAATVEKMQRHAEALVLPAQSEEASDDADLTAPANDPSSAVRAALDEAKQAETDAAATNVPEDQKTTTESAVPTGNEMDAQPAKLSEPVRAVLRGFSEKFEADMRKVSGGQGIPVGSEGSRAAIKLDAHYSFMRHLSKGLTPHDAAYAADVETRALIRKHNARHTDTNQIIAENAYTGVIDNIAAAVERAQNEPAQERVGKDGLTDTQRREQTLEATKGQPKGSIGAENVDPSKPSKDPNDRFNRLYSLVGRERTGLTDEAMTALVEARTLAKSNNALAAFLNATARFASEAEKTNKGTATEARAILQEFSGTAGFDIEGLITPEATAALTAENTPDPNPTDAQKEAGNYKLGHITVGSLPVSIENTTGSERSGIDADGNKWSVVMPADYGYIKRTEGADGDHVDVYVGPNHDSDSVLVINQHDDRTGKFDEHKVMLGFNGPIFARNAYVAGFSDGRGSNRIGSTVELTMDEFKERLKDKDAWLKPLSQTPTPPTKTADQDTGDQEAMKKANAMRLKIQLDKPYQGGTLRQRIERGDYASAERAEVPRITFDRRKFNRMNEAQQAKYNKQLAETKTEFHLIRADDPEAYTAVPKMVFDWFNENHANKKPEDQETTSPPSGPAQQDAIPESEPKTGGDPAPAKIEDFGQKIGGARKDKAKRLAQDMGQDVDATGMTMAEAFPVPDYEALAASGIPQKDLAALGALRGSIPRKKPRKASSWARKVKASRQQAQLILTGQADRDTVAKTITDNSGYMGAKAHLDVFELLPVAALHDASMNTTVRGRSISGTEADAYDYVVSRFGSRYGVETFNTAEQAAAYVLQGLKEINDRKAGQKKTGSARKPVKLGVYKDQFAQAFYVGFSIKGTLRLSKNFDKTEDARAFLKENTEQLQQEADTLRDGMREHLSTSRERKGPDHRTGNATPEMFTEAFGFRGVEFGNWNNKEDRQDALNRAYDALHDLAGVLGVPTQVLSLDGALGLAFGARGTGGKNPAAAHYEPDLVVINLTKKHGAGSLAHEWFHAVDHHLAKIDAEDTEVSAATTSETSRRNEMMSNRRRHRDGGRAEGAYVAFKALEALLVADHPFMQRAKEYDKARQKPYFSTVIELAARSFERYVRDRLTQRGMVNDYLANIDTSSGAYPSTRELKNTGLRGAWDEAISQTVRLISQKDGTPPVLPEADPSRLYEGPEAGEVWQTLDGKAKVETRTGSDLTVKMPDGSTEYFTPEELDERMEDDRKAVLDAKNKRIDDRRDKRLEQREEADALDKRAEMLISRFEKDTGRKGGAVNRALMKGYSFDGAYMTRRAKIVQLVENENATVVAKWGKPNLYWGENLSYAYGSGTWTKAGLDFAEWYKTIHAAKVTTSPADAVRKALDEAKTDKPKDQKTTKDNRGAGQAGKDAVSKLGSAATNYVDGLMNLFGTDDQLNSGFTFSKETYAKAKPFFDAAMRDLGDAKADLMQMARALVARLIDAGMSADARDEMEPYLTEYLTEVQKGEHDPFVAPEPEATKTATTDMQPVTAEALKRFRAGEGFKNIVEARKMAADALGAKIEPEQHKAIEEAIEEAIVIRARELVASSSDPRVKFDALADLYQQQPILGQRTSTSVELQAYSTPAPLAFVAAQLAGISDQTTVLEPTAGLGMLTITALPANVTANELDPARAAGIKRTTDGATITNMDATQVGLPQSDVVIANPPFGPVMLDGKRQTWVLGNTTTGEIDHAIVWRSLQAMPDDGSAVFLVGGVKGQKQGAERVKGYRVGSKNKFFKTLYDNYNVVDHFTVDGDLYSRQGASWPVDVITIRGKGKSELPLPQKEAPPILTTWDEIKGKLELADSLGTAELTADRSGKSDIAAEQPAGDAGNVSGRNDNEAGTGDPQRGPSGTDTVEQSGKPDDQTASAGDTASNSSGDSGSDGPTGRAGPEPTGVSGQADEDGSQRGNSSDAGGTNADGPANGDQPDVDARAANTEVETVFQVQYEPRSKARYAVGTLVPRKMQDAMHKALDGIEAKHGDIDVYVADALGYTLDELLGTNEKPGYFSAEQVDALAMAIDNVSQSKGFIIGDQTGVGKGRFVAAMLRYAERQGRTPVFVTKDKGLYADMIRDLRDIGEAQAHKGVFVTNNDLRGAGAIPLSTADGDVLEGLSEPLTKRAIDQIAQTGELPIGARYLFTTYSQMQTVAGKEPQRRAALRALASNSMFLLDESHEAGGGGSTGSYTDPDAPPDRAAFVRELLANAKGAVYSSATYAKNPSVMSLYATTDLSLAVEKTEDLAGAIERGGVPLQQVVANQLVEAGQYARRERSFDGVDMVLDTIETDIDMVTNVTARIADIFDADVLHLEQARKDAIEKYEEQGFAQTVDGAVGVQSGNSVSFAAVVHNVISQMLLAIKVDGVAERAIASHKAGEKPIIAVYNTNGALLDAVIEDQGLSAGDPVDVPFSVILHRYVERLRNITVRDDSNEESKRITLTDAQLGPSAANALKQLHKDIDATDFGTLSGAPLDQLHDKLRAAGIKTGEITGRGRVVENGKIVMRDQSSAAKKRQMFAYNKGDLDALIINQAGSTGYSMHATGQSDNDGKQRRMIIMQADPNIDVFMQMLGRIHRTGQVKLPKYSIAISDLSAEKRVSAILMRKMASLNANTTASKDSAVSLSNVTDFLNVVGNAVVRRYLSENTDIQIRLDVDMDHANIAQALTGRLAILPPQETARIYDEIEELYKTELEELDKLGENPLEAQVFDWQAKVLTKGVVSKAQGGTSPFAKETTIEYLSVKRLAKPYTWAETLDRLETFLEDSTPEQQALEVANRIKELITEYLAVLDAKLESRKKVVDDLKAQSDNDDAPKTAKIAKAEKTVETTTKAIADAKKEMKQLVHQISELEIGNAVVVGTPLGDYSGVILDVDISRLTDNPLALSKIRVRIAVADAARELVLPLSRLDGVSYTVRKSTPQIVQAAFEFGQSSSREVRAVATGNLINAVAKFQTGQIAFFTDENGETRTGVVMPKGFDVNARLQHEPVVFKTPQHIAEFLSVKNRLIATADGMLQISREGQGTYSVQAKSKAKGYYIGKPITDITGEWQSRGSAPRKVTLDSEATLLKLIAHYQETTKPTFQAEAHKEVARAITGTGMDEITVPTEATERRRKETPATKRMGRTKLRNILKRRLSEAGLSDIVTLNIVKSITNRHGDKIDGYSMGRIIGVAMDSDNAVETFDHEVIHALRSAEIWGPANGVFTTTEWRALVALVRRDPRRLDAIKAQYPDLTNTQQIEEAVAELYADYRAGRDVDTAVGVLGRVRAALEAIGGVLRGEGYRSPQQVLAAIADGSLVARLTDAETDGPDGPNGGPSVRERRRKRAGADATRAERVIDRALDVAEDVAARTKDAFTRQSLRAGVSNAMAHGDSGASILALVPGRPLLTEMAKKLPSAKVYLTLKEQMDALRNKWAGKTDEIAKKWQFAAFKNKEANAAFMDLMHDATLAGIDPQDANLDDPTIDRLLRENDQGQGEAKGRIRAKILQEHKTLRERYAALPEDFKDIWGGVRDLYAALADDWDNAIIANHEKGVARSIRKMQAQHDKDVADLDRGGLSQAQKKKAKTRLDKDLQDAIDRAKASARHRMSALRAAFESTRIQKPYFPLARFGDYYVTLKDESGNVVSFSRFEGEKAQMKFAAQHEGKYEVITGVLSKGDGRLDQSVDPAFVAEIADILTQEGVDNEVMDAIWQRYLETMPDMSLRKNRIHRKGREGYTNDALRAFANHMFHGAHQLARLTHEIDMADALDEMKTEAEAVRVDKNRAMHVVNEVTRRHEFTMSPKNAGWTAAASSMAFIWYLGMTPAAALVNLTQTTIIGIPVMRAKFDKASVSQVSTELGRAMKDFAKGKGRSENSDNLTNDERLAMKEAYDRALIDKTQANDIAGLAETGISYNPTRARAMEAISFAYHHAERANREVTFLAGYRLARAEGATKSAAIDKAAQVTWDVHFDYQNNSRPRFMQDDWPKVLLTFRNFQVNMLYRLVRDTHQSMKGETPEARLEARRQLIGITASMAAQAGITGVWGYNLIMMVVGLFFGDGGDDEAKLALRKLMVGAQDPSTTAGHVRRFVGTMAMDGFWGTMIGADLSERIGMPSLWFREPYRDMEGRELYTHYVAQLIGPVPSIAERIVVGADQWLDGNIWRGTETAAPKGIRDLMRGYRYLQEGVTTYRNNEPVVPDISPYQAFVQAIGFTPAEISERYEVNNYLKNAEYRIEQERRDTLSAIRRDIAANNGLSDSMMERLVMFNRTYPEWPITSETIQRSIQGAARASANNTQGVVLNSRLEDRLRQNAPPTVYD